MIYERTTNRLIPIADRVKVATSKLGRAMRRLQENGDSVIGGRHVCVGYALYKSPNAKSYPAGYIVVDPTLLLQLRQASAASDFIDEYIYYHEW